MIKLYSASVGPYMTDCYIITDEESGESAAVDCALFDGDYEYLLRSSGVSSLKYILLTHGHFDHISGVKKLKETCGGTICIHPDDADCLTDPSKSLNQFTNYAVQEPVTADILVGEGSVLMLGNTEIKVMHTPGHTRGSVCYLVGDIMFSGDTLFRCSMGRTDFPGGSTKQLFASLARIGQMDGDLAIYPGHGEKTILAFEKEYNRYLRAK